MIAALTESSHCAKPCDHDEVNEPSCVV